MRFGSQLHDWQRTVLEQRCLDYLPPAAVKITRVRVPTKGKTLPAKVRVHLLVDTHSIANATL